MGYCVRFDDMTSSKTRAKFMTDGILVRECLSDPMLSKYQAVMLDVSAPLLSLPSHNNYNSLLPPLSLL